MKSLTFRAHFENAGITGHEPGPARKALPEWIRRISRFTDNRKKFFLKSNGENNYSIKACNPFTDALTAGYMIYLESDLQVEQIDGYPNFTWNWGGEGFISTHSQKQIDGMPLPDWVNKQPYKFANWFVIKTPPGYSCLITHPVNRPELPFYTLSGVVDTDKHDVPINLPFLFSNTFEGVIRAGTPIAQVIPFRRESWSSKHEAYDKDKSTKSQAKISHRIGDAYKKFVWTRKSYE